MPRLASAHQRRAAASPRENFISHKVQSNQPGRLHGFIEIAVDRVFNHRPQLFEGVALGVNAVTQCGSRIATVHFVFAHLKDNLAHESILEGCLDHGKQPQKRRRFTRVGPHRS
jgi:hypothetical protein